MPNDLVARLRKFEGSDYVADGDFPTCEEAADRIEELQDTIAKIQYMNLRRDMNVDNRTKEIERLCKRTQT